MMMHPLLHFNHPELLTQALTHRSYINENPHALGHNERLEFLGDAILTMLSGEYLYQTYPTMAEGEMTRRRAALVNEKQLAQFAIQVGLSNKIFLSKGITVNANLLSSAFESVVGAYYLDHDAELKTLRPLIQELFETVDLTITEDTRDPKTRFQELVQSSRPHSVLPKYITQKIGGSDHAPEFKAWVYLENRNQVYGEGIGKNTKEAERNAATQAIAKWQDSYFPNNS